jgi:oligopeptidase B
MKIPQLRKQTEKKSCHSYEWEDDYSWVHQKNCLEILRDKAKLNPEVKTYLEQENIYTEKNTEDTKPIQKELFTEIEGRIKLEDESLKFKDLKYEYWTKTTEKGNYSKQLRKKISGIEIETYWDGDIEAEGKKFFSAGDIEVSNNDELLAYSIDDKGSEYFTINIRRISDKKIIEEPILETSGSITWAYDDLSFFYTKLDSLHRPRKIYQHRLGSSVKGDKLIYEEKDERFTCGIGTSSDEKFYFISTSEHTTSEIYYIDKNNKDLKPKIFIAREEGVQYSINSWNDFFWMNTNKNAEDFKISRCLHKNINDWMDFIPSKEGTLIGGLTFLNDWIIRSEISNALAKIYIRNIKTNAEEELKITEEQVISPGISLMQKDKNTDVIRIGYDSPKTPSRTYEYNIKTKEKKLIKEQMVPSGHNRDDYIVERLNCASHDGRQIPMTITYHKKTKLDGNAHVLLYGYGSYGMSMGPNFSSTSLSLINRNIIWVTCHIRGGMERGMRWWKEGKMLNKKNTFSDFICCAKFLIEKKYTSKKKIIAYGGSAGGLLLGNIVNQVPDLLLGAIMAVPFVDNLTTNMDHSLPLTKGELLEFGDAKNNKKHFEYILGYAPYNNIEKKDYPHILITTSLSDSRVLFDEPTKYCAKLRDFKTDNNLLLMKCEMDAGHGGKSGRTAAIEEIAFDYAFALKISNKI